ncbi:hypothetical protein ACI3E1_07090 [Ligilactobacillus sp. LYQ139]|uniref:hypothetical protein n=1 Tax=Ligilactobacillus sp. LYQ139 TaxID=3378800 RepID=UPI00385361CE
MANITFADGKLTFKKEINPKLVGLLEKLGESDVYGFNYIEKVDDYTLWFEGTGRWSWSAVLERLFDTEWYGQGTAQRIFSQLPTVVQSETTMTLTYTDIGVDEGFIEKGKVQYVFRNGRFVVDKVLVQQNVPYTLENLCATGYSEAEPVVSNEDLDVIINQFRNEYGERQVPMPLQWTPEQLLQLKQFIQQNEFLQGLWSYDYPDDALPWITDFMDETFKETLETEHE